MKQWFAGMQLWKVLNTSVPVFYPVLTGALSVKTVLPYS